MNVFHFVPLHQVDVEIYHSITESFDLLMALEEKSEVQQSCMNSSFRDLEYVLNLMAYLS